VSGTLAAEHVAPHVRGRFGKPYRYEPECESTQLLLLESGLPEGAVAATDHQTGGKGRHGRQWVAPPGTSVLASVMLHPPPDRHLPELSLVAALAAAEAKVNLLTHDVGDPLIGTPEYKVSAVRLERV
jgi:BirA family biotin operon repressor/biotin-[acetyl-CoA-carboxylase] ligase